LYDDVDIEGAQADTLKRCLHTKRSTNPLYPVYKSLDGGEPLEPLLKPLIPASAIVKPTLTNKMVDIAPSPTTTTKLPDLNLKQSLVPFDWNAGSTCELSAGNLFTQTISNRSNPGLQSATTTGRKTPLNLFSKESYGSGGSRGGTGRLVYTGKSLSGRGSTTTPKVVMVGGGTLSSRDAHKVRQAKAELQADIEAVRNLA
jgi:hypothetical protein